MLSNFIVVFKISKGSQVFNKMLSFSTKTQAENAIINHTFTNYHGIYKVQSIFEVDELGNVTHFYYDEKTKQIRRLTDISSNNETFLKEIRGFFKISEKDGFLTLEESTPQEENPMTILLNKKDDKSLFLQFEEYVKNFNVDKEVDKHREDEEYRNTFSIRESLEDFECFKSWLETVLEEIIS